MGQMRHKHEHPPSQQTVTENSCSSPKWSVMAWLDRPVHGILVSDEQTTNRHNASVHFIYIAPSVKA